MEFGESFLFYFDADVLLTICNYLSKAGLIAQIVFMAWGYSKLKESEGYAELTEFNWVVLAIYIALCVLTQRCKDMAYADYVPAANPAADAPGKSSRPKAVAPGSSSSSNSLSRVGARKRCKGCFRFVDENAAYCPDCGGEVFD